MEYKPKLDITKEHISKLVENYDILIRQLIPEYETMQKNVVEALRFQENEEITVLDLGVGTGESAQRIIERFPNAQLIGIDLVPEMIKAAKTRLHKNSNRVEFITGDIIEIDLPNNLDAVVSTLAIHHLADQQKQKIYKKIFQALKPGGYLSVGDLVKFRDSEKTAKTEETWREFIIGNLGQEQGQYRFDEYKKGDIPSALEDQLDWLKESGFVNIEKSWELMNYATFSGKRHEN